MTKSSDMTLHPGESARAGVCRVADSLIQETLGSIRKPGSDPAENVHLIRTTTKRLRAFLRLLRPVISREVCERENARCKRVARQFASARGSSVARETLAALLQVAAEPGARARSIVKRFPDSSASLPDRSAPEMAMDEAARELKNVRRAFRDLRGSPDDWALLGSGLERVYKQARRRMKAAFAEKSDDGFHRWRIRVKALRYLLQLLESMWPKRLSKTIASLRELEKTLGDNHDISELKFILGSASSKLGSGDVLGRVNTSAHVEMRRLRRASHALGKKVFENKPRRFVRQIERRWLDWQKAP